MDLWLNYSEKVDRDHEWEGGDDISCLDYLIIKIDAGKKLSTFSSLLVLFLPFFLSNSS